MKRQYKDSGIEWIGKIPETWEVCRFKDFLSLKNEPSNSPNKIGLENIESETGHFIPSTSTFDGNGTAFTTGDVVYGKLRPYLRKVWLADCDGNAVGDFFVFRCKINVNNQYAKWLLLSDGFTEIVNSSTFGAKMPRVSSNFILTLPYYLPSISEQQRIADYLDEKCGEIDSLIALQEQMIEKLKAYKQSVITETVTKGLDPNAKLVPSGIDWIGEISEKYNLIKFKYIFQIIGGCGFKDIYQGETEGDYPFCKASDINGDSIYVNSAKNWVNEELVKKEKYNIIPKGSILISKIGEALKKNHRKINNCDCIVDNNCEGFSNKSSNEIKMLYYILKCVDMSWFDNQGTIPSINNEKLKNSYLPIPPICEQKEMINYLDSKCTEVDRLIALKQQKIASLKDYKKSVIYEAVTGKTVIE